MKVLLATDGSEHADAAIRCVSSIPGAQAWDFKLAAVQLSMVVGMYDELTHAMLLEGESARAQGALDRGMAILKEAQASADTVMLAGHAGDEIVNLAATWKADLVVLGARGHSTLDRILLGSTSDFVATHAPCSVLVCRVAPDAARSGGKGLKVLVPYDHCEAAKKTLTRLSQGLVPDDSQVHLVHVIERPLLLDETIRYDPAWSVTLKQEMESAKGLLGEKLAAGARTTVMEANYVAEAICEQAVNEGVDWVAIGERGRSQISRVFLGSNSRFVLRHAACSVLLVR